MDGIDLEEPQPVVFKRRVIPCPKCASIRFTASATVADFDQKGWYSMVTETCENGHARTERRSCAAIKPPSELLPW